MGYIQKNLMQNEQVVYEARLHKIVFLAPCFIAFCALGILFISSFSWTVRLILLFAVWLGAFIWGVNIHGGKLYVVTTRRLIFKRGIIRRRSLELMLRKCEGIQIEQSILGRILNYGTVLVTTGEATNRYDYVQSPLKFSTCINQQIENAKEAV